MLFNLSTLLFIIAGLLNGSFVIPARYVKNLTNEKIWFYHAIIGLAIIPWIILAFMLPGEVHNYLSLQPSILLFIILSGVIFGLGQVCFAYSIESIGIALSFTINIGIGLTIGSMFVIFYKNVFFTTHGYLVTLAVFLILASLIIYYYAGKNELLNKNQPNSHYHRTWLLASLTGLTSGLQNIAFVIVAFNSTNVFHTNNSFWFWPPFLLAAAIPMALGFLYRIKESHVSQFIYANKVSFFKNTVLIVVMGLFFTGSLALYSLGMSQLTHQQQIVGWPAFMVSIIFVSQLWGWLHRESSDITVKNKLNMSCSVALLVIAIIILAVY